MQNILFFKKFEELLIKVLQRSEKKMVVKGLACLSGAQHRWVGIIKKMPKNLMTLFGRLWKVKKIVIPLKRCSNKSANRLTNTHLHMKIISF